MAAIVISGSVDASNLNAALQLAQQFSSRTPERCANSAGVVVLNRVIELTPHVSPAQIDSELATIVYYARTKTGRASTAARNRRYKGGVSAIQQVQRVPLAVLIVLARMNKAGLNRPPRGTSTSSNYNVSTHDRWVLEAGGSFSMNAVIHRMIAARHSSSKFLILGWVEARRDMRGAAFGEPPTIDAETGLTVEKDFGRAQPARGGKEVAVCVIENLVGLGKSKNAANYNRALLEHGQGPLQQAVDEVAEDKFRHVFEKLFAQELAPAWNRLAN